MFDPERFVSPTHPRVVDFDLPFGFGRRICPGQHVALQSIFIVISRSVQPVLFFFLNFAHRAHSLNLPFFSFI